MNCTALLVRHGRYRQPPGVPGAHLGHPLTARGRRQARAAAALIRSAAGPGPLHPVVQASPLLRAWETASLIAAELNREEGGTYRVEEQDALAERSVGSATNLTVRAIDRLLKEDPRYEVTPPGWDRDPDYRLPFPGAESLMEAGARVVHHVQAALTVASGSGSVRQVFVGHSGAFVHALVQWNLLDKEVAREVSFPHGVPVPVDWDPATGIWSLPSRDWMDRPD